MTVHLLDEKKHLFHIRKYKDNLKSSVGERSPDLLRYQNDRFETFL